MMKILNFYLSKIKACKVGSNKHRVVAYKPGSTIDKAKRGIPAEFRKYSNANGQKYDNEIFEDICDLNIGLPEQHLKLLEDFIKKDFFTSEELFFSTKEEYFISDEETHNKFNFLYELLKKEESKLQKFCDTIKEVKEEQRNIYEMVEKQFNDILENIKSQCNNFLQPLKNIVVREKFVNSPNKQISNATIEASIGKKPIYDCLLSDFQLYEDKLENKLYLQHNEYHKNKNPKEPFGAFTCSTANNNKPKFQFHNTNNSHMAQYNQRGVQATKAYKIFADKNRIIDISNKDSKLKDNNDQS